MAWNAVLTRESLGLSLAGQAWLVCSCASAPTGGWWVGSLSLAVLVDGLLVAKVSALMERTVGCSLWLFALRAYISGMRALRNDSG